MGFTLRACALDALAVGLPSINAELARASAASRPGSFKPWLDGGVVLSNVEHIPTGYCGAVQTSGVTTSSRSR